MEFLPCQRCQKCHKQWFTITKNDNIIEKQRLNLTIMATWKYFPMKIQILLKTARDKLLKKLNLLVLIKKMYYLSIIKSVCTAFVLAVNNLLLINLINYLVFPLYSIFLLSFSFQYQFSQSQVLLKAVTLTLCPNNLHHKLILDFLFSGKLYMLL